MAFLAHYLNTPIDNILEWSISKIDFWATRAETLRSKLNKSEVSE